MNGSRVVVPDWKVLCKEQILNKSDKERKIQCLR